MSHNECVPLVYQVTNMVTGNRYIGRSAYGLKERINSHLRIQPHVKNAQTPFARAVRKYGADMFRFSILMICQTAEHAVVEERRLISLLRPEYNIRRGGGPVGWKNKKPKMTRVLPKEWCLQGEIWKAVVGYEGLYEVSDLGRVRALPRNAGKSKSATGGWPGKIIKQSETRYPHVGLSCRNKSKTWQIHTLVAAAFIGPRPNGMVVRHKDDNKKNIRVGNLCYGTQKENINDSIANGKIRIGEMNVNSSLTDSSVLEIRNLHTLGKTMADIARAFSVSEFCVASIVKGRTWRHLLAAA